MITVIYIEAYLNLHIYISFFIECYANKYRCVLILLLLKLESSASDTLFNAVYLLSVSLQKSTPTIDRTKKPRIPSRDLKPSTLNESTKTEQKPDNGSKLEFWPPVSFMNAQDSSNQMPKRYW